jgi:hypothetical protein
MASTVLVLIATRLLCPPEIVEQHDVNSDLHNPHLGPDTADLESSQALMTMGDPHPIYGFPDCVCRNVQQGQAVPSASFPKTDCEC